MTNIEEIRKVLNGTEVHDNGNSSFEYSILASISEVVASDNEIEEYADQKNVNWEEVKRLAIMANRIKHSFKTREECESFCANNETGKWWFSENDDDLYYVYSY